MSRSMKALLRDSLDDLYRTFGAELVNETIINDAVAELDASRHEIENLRRELDRAKAALADKDVTPAKTTIPEGCEVVPFTSCKDCAFFKERPCCYSKYQCGYYYHGKSIMFERKPSLKEKRRRALKWGEWQEYESSDGGKGQIRFRRGAGEVGDE